MTRYGIIISNYSRMVKPRPFSLFTKNHAEQRANNAWRKEAKAWGELNVDEYGHVTSANEDAS